MTSSMEDYDSHFSLKHKIRSSTCFSCCFRSAATADDLEDQPPSLIRSSSTWIRSKAHEFPEFKDRCRSLISRMGRHHHRKCQSADFRYDPLSYALNFDEGISDELELVEDEEFRHRNFASRLPASPQVPARAVVPVAVGL